MNPITVLLLTLMFSFMSACAPKTPELLAPCPEFGKRCTQVAINSLVDTTYYHK